jgi:hypothetical protein
MGRSPHLTSVYLGWERSHYFCASANPAIPTEFSDLGFQPDLLCLRFSGYLLQFAIIFAGLLDLYPAFP